VGVVQRGPDRILAAGEDVGLALYLSRLAVVPLLERRPAGADDLDVEVVSPLVVVVADLDSSLLMIP